MPKNSPADSRHEISPQPNAKPRIFYGYILVGASFVLQVLIWGTFNSYGVFFNPLLDTFGWSRTTISGAVSLCQFVIGFGAIFLGYLNDRFGPRILIALGGIVTGLGYYLMSQVNAIWQLYLFYGLIIGIGIGGADVILLGTTARWFIRRRSMMSGIVKIGTGVGIMIMPIIIDWLISHHGFRASFAVIGIALFTAMVLGAQLLRRDPARMGQLPDGERTRPELNLKRKETGLLLGEAVHTLRFWMLCVAFFAVLFCTLTIIIHFAPYIIDLGFTQSFGATMLSGIGGASIIGRLFMGITGDRIGSKRALLICFAILIAAYSWLLIAREIWALLIFTLVYGFCHGGFYALISPTVAEFFGTRAHGAIFGIVIFCGSLGGAIGPILTGYVFDITRSYRTAFLILLALAVVGFVSILISGKTKYSPPPGESGII